MFGRSQLLEPADLHDNGAALQATVTTAYTGSAGLQIAGAGADIYSATNGPAVSLATVTTNLTPATITSTNSASTGVSLTSVSGTFTAGNGSSITNATGTDFFISQSSANVTYAGTITDDTGQLITISSCTGTSTKAFTGAITDGDDGDGTGITISGNSAGTTINFAGGVVLSTGVAAAFGASGAGTLQICDESGCNGAATGALINKFTTTTGTPLNVNGVTIGAAGLELRSVSANGAPNGIVLNNTGSTGSLKVKGNVGAGSGGTIQNTTGDAISLTSTRTPSFTFVNVSSTGGQGLNANSLTSGLTLTSCQFTNTGDGDDEHAIRLFDVSGTASIQGLISTTRPRTSST